MGHGHDARRRHTAAQAGGLERDECARIECTVPCSGSSTLMNGFPFIAVLAELLSAQSPSVPCCNCGVSGRSHDVVCLSAKEMRDHVWHVEPLRLSGLDKGLNLAGTVVVQMRFDGGGKPVCAYAKSGHPIAISSTMDAVRKWTFKPVVLRGVAKDGCGLITIKYRPRDQGSSTKLQ